MKHTVTALAIGIVVLSQSFVAIAQDDQCADLQTLIDAAQEYFKDVRGEATSLDIRGVAKPYHRSTAEFKQGVEMLITEDEWYPEGISYLAKTRFYSDELQTEYDRVKQLLTDCLPEWVFVEKDKNNDIYLEDTEYRKAIFSENKKGKKVKIEVFMYNQRELDTWVVEFKMHGVGKKL